MRPCCCRSCCRWPSCSLSHDRKITLLNVLERHLSARQLPKRKRLRYSPPSCCRTSSRLPRKVAMLGWSGPTVAWPISRARSNCPRAATAAPAPGFQAPVRSSERAFLVSIPLLNAGRAPPAGRTHRRLSSATDPRAPHHGNSGKRVIPQHAPPPWGTETRNRRRPADRAVLSDAFAPVRVPPAAGGKPSGT
jgi:hypothetical protein